MWIFGRVLIADVSEYNVERGGIALGVRRYSRWMRVDGEVRMWLSQKTPFRSVDIWYYHKAPLKKHGSSAVQDIALR